MFKMPLLTVLMYLLCFSAYSKSFIRTHEDYSHLSDNEKDQLIIKTMELVVELESKYNYEVEKYGFNQQRYETFQKTIVKIQSLLLPSAYAAEPQIADLKDVANWNRFASNFTMLFNSTKGANCIFAGWPSTMHKGRNNKTYCSHPGGPNASQKIKDRYPTPIAGTGCNKNDTSRIQCNPALFGFKKVSDNSLFCVEAYNDAKNSAYHCMKEALKDTDESDKSQDTKEKRLAIIRQGLTKNPDAFKALQDYVYKVCVCETTPENFDKSYQSRIRPHRTCYGMMDMLGEITMCTDPGLVMDTSIFKSLRDFAKETIYQTATETQVDKHYSDFLEKEVKKIAPEEYKRLCGTDGGINVDVNPPEGTPGGVPGKDVVPDPGVPGGTPAGQTSGGEPTTDEKKYVCSLAKCNKPQESAEEIGCKFTITEETSGEPITLVDTPKYTPPKKEDTSVSILAKIEDKEVTLECSPVEFESAPETETTPTLSVTITKKTDFFYSIKAETKDDKGWSFAWSFEDQGTLTIDKGWAVETPEKKDPATTPTGTASDSPPATEGPADTTPPATTSGEGKTVQSDSKEIPAQKRYTVSYKVCGQLTKGDKKVPETPSCVTVDKLNTVAPKGGNQQQGQPPMQIRGSSDTSAVGIR